MSGPRNEVPNCPACGKPMRLDKSTDGMRSWLCQDFMRVSTGACRGLINIGADERLSVGAIKSDLARATVFNNSDTHRKEQAKARRLAGGLKGYQDNKYISKPEREALVAAAELLERLGTAAELAKTELKRLEQEENLRQAGREREVRKLLADFAILPSDPKEAIPMLLALDAVVQHSYRRLPIALQEEMRTKNGKDLRWRMNSIHRDTIEDVFRQIVRDQRPVADLVQVFTNAMAAKRAEQREQAQHFAEQVTVILVQQRLSEVNPGAPRRL